MKTILITGGSRGIGKAIVEDLAKDGYNVILNYNKSIKQAKDIQLQLNKEGFNIEIYKADVSNEQEVKDMVEYCITKFHNIDVLVNNAGISQMKLFTEITIKDWDRIMDINLKSVFLVSKEIIKYMISRKSGCIINMSSVWGMVGGSCEVHYSASKAGIIGLTKALAKEVGPSNIRVNTVAPGCIDTEMNSLTETEKEMIKQETALQRIGKPEDITKCIKWLIEDEFITGQIISPNGGWIIN